MSASPAETPLARDRRSAIRFPVSTSLKYEFDGRIGTAVTLDVSSGGIAFQTDRVLRIGKSIRLIMNWPAALDGRLPLSLVVEGKVLRSTPFSSAVTVSRYEFRLRVGKPKLAAVKDGSQSKPGVTGCSGL